MSRGAIGSRLELARREAGLTHRALAEKAGVSPGTISGIENGKHDATTEKVAQLARALSVEPCWLAYGDRDKAPKWWGKDEPEMKPTRKRSVKPSD